MDASTAPAFPKGVKYGDIRFTIGCLKNFSAVRSGNFFRTTTHLTSEYLCDVHKAPLIKHDVLSAPDVGSFTEQKLAAYTNWLAHVKQEEFKRECPPTVTFQRKMTEDEISLCSDKKAEKTKRINIDGGIAYFKFFADGDCVRKTFFKDGSIDITGVTNL